MNSKGLLIVTALIEVGTGLALLAVPSLTAELLLGEGFISPPAVVVARVAGVALIWIAVACWLGRNAERRELYGLVAGMLIYNLSMPIVLIHAWFSLSLEGLGLWPASLLHAGLAIWCSVSLRPLSGSSPGSSISAPVPRHRSSLERWALRGLCLVVVGGGTWALFEFVVWNRIPAELVGKWVVTDGPQEGATFDFYRSGRMTGRVNQGGQLGIVNATVRVEGQTILSTTRHSRTGQEVTIVQHIRTVTPTRLVVEDEKGNRLNMERAR